MSTQRTNARIGAQHPIRTERDDARAAALAELGIAAHDFAEWAEGDSGYASLPATHAARRMVRAYHRASRSVQEIESVDRVLATATPDERARAAAAIEIGRRR